MLCRKNLYFLSGVVFYPLDKQALVFVGCGKPLGPRGFAAHGLGLLLALLMFLQRTGNQADIFQRLGFVDILW